MPDVLFLIVGQDIKTPEEKEAYGLTYPGANYSIIEGWYVLHSGVMAYEAKLQIMDELFPGQGEGEDITWMQERNIV